MLTAGFCSPLATFFLWGFLLTNSGPALGLCELGRADLLLTFHSEDVRIAATQTEADDPI